jgi:putative PIN family toxin of toxin-antitoxin system
VRILLDTNVLLSGFLFSGLPREVLLLTRTQHELVTTAAIVTEFERVLLDKFDFPPTLVVALRTEIESSATMVEAPQRPGVLQDPVDDEILGVAAAAQADFVVTGDRQLRAVGHHKQVVILTPREFLDRHPERD